MAKRNFPDGAVVAKVRERPEVVVGKAVKVAKAAGAAVVAGANVDPMTVVERIVVERIVVAVDLVDGGMRRKAAANSPIQHLA
ncbi:hypothetical protein HNR46_002541 [Haloferula luteola]|uniref:Uncharacterized protein n=1 Tax=Haloferula luteola TaxID=595692 RepID=A0A840VCA9_9BACT|nr:hypothetical protein [Haloferula luteola]MBB5352298.1 hypothetical protein [Haloferula luteola]